jgi:hypothetical protein
VRQSVPVCCTTISHEVLPGMLHFFYNNTAVLSDCVVTNTGQIKNKYFNFLCYFKTCVYILPSHPHTPTMIYTIPSTSTPRIRRVLCSHPRSVRSSPPALLAPDSILHPKMIRTINDMWMDDTGRQWYS